MKDPQPRGDRVVVRVMEDNERPGGIVLPPNTVTRPSLGFVLHVGPGWRTTDGSYVPLDLHPGDIVMFFARNGIEIVLNDETCVLLRDEHIMLVTEPAATRETSDQAI